MVPVEQRFWSKVRKSTGCWEWCGSYRGIYGQFALRRGTNGGAHRASWILTYGEIKDGLWVLHKCDNPKCVRPDHLFLGTTQDNTADRNAKGRQATGAKVIPKRLARGDSHWAKRMPEKYRRGSKHHYARLNEAIVREIRRRYAAGGVSQRQLARDYGVVKGTITFILQGKTWRHILAVEPSEAPSQAAE